MDDPTFYYQRGNVYLKMKAYEESHDDYDIAINLDNNNP